MTYTEKETIEKFKIVAKNDSRTMSKELEYIVKEKIKEYEKENGKIILVDDFFAERAQKPPKQKKKE